MDDARLDLLRDKDSSDITVLVIAESQHQRLAFSETVRSCGFTLIDCVSRAQLRHYSQVDIWLVDSVYDDHVENAIAGSGSSAVLVGFSQAPYLNEAQHYAKWQRKLKRKLAQILAMPSLIESPVYNSSIKPWRYVVFLGASMGGPSAVKAFLDHLSPTLPICLLLAHHFNSNMMETLPRILTRHNDWQCQVISITQQLKSGYCLIAPIEQQIVCDSEGRVILSEQPWSGEYKPAIGQLLKNASDVYGSELVSIVFSGMGCDGSQYLDTIQDNDSQLWAQDPSLSTCSSQPQAIIDSGYCQFIGSPEALAQKLTDYVNGTTSVLSET
ncbi:chemotaxis protein CheB [Psychrobacter urativorans]|uniref:protein-glutamate methylesterase n=2 Tax=Psychrobacter urativorans TaxID=45610 RepID=A0A0M3V9J3_9GAMM|nr:chemotaxis protein CheB [Psychrobacter urativorans]